MHELNNIVVIGLVSLAWIIVCFALFVGFDGGLSWSALILFGLFVYTSIMLWKTVFDKRIAPLEIMFWMFHTNFLLLPALSQSFHSIFYRAPFSTYQHEDLLYACFIIIVGLFAFKVGSGLGRRKSLSVNSRMTNVGFFERALEARLEVYVVLIILFIGLVILVSSLGVDFFLSSRTSKLGQVESLAEFGLFLALPKALALGSLLFSIALLVQRRRQGKRAGVGLILIIICALGLNAIINFPLSVARFWVFGFLIGLVWIVTPLRSVSFRCLFVIGMTILQFTIFPWYSQITRGKGQVELNIESLRQYMHHGDFDGFQSIVDITLYIQESGFELGRNIVSVILFFVPRDYWDKAQPLGAAAAEFKGYEYTNLSAPIYGEFYADFGLFSLVIGMSIVGFWMSIYDGYYDRMVRSKRFGVGVLFTAVLAGFLIILLRGSLLGVVSSIAVLFGTFLILSWVSARAGRCPGFRMNHIQQ